VIPIVVASTVFFCYLMWAVFGTSYRDNFWATTQRSQEEHFRRALGIGFVVSAIIGFGGNLVFMNADYASVQREGFVTDVVNLHDGSETEGSGGLFYFVVETYPRFTYYVRNSDGSFSPEYVDDDVDHGVRIFEDGQADPHLSCMTDHVTRTSDLWSMWGPVSNSHACHDYVFHVPPGSVSRRYSLGGGGTGSSGGN
jgi:hypothetical protein